MLISAVISLKARKDAAARPRGRAVHAWFLQQVARHDAALAGYLHHGDKGIRPFTVSDVRSRLDRFSPRGEPIYGGNRYVIRVTSVMPELSELLEREALPDLTPRLDLAGAFFEVMRTTTEARKHAWAGRSSRKRLWQDSADAHTASVGLLFASPTTFRSQGAFVPVPWPRLVFQSLVRKWNLFADIPLPEEVLDVIETSLAIRGYNLQATGIALNKDEGMKMPAFWGKCEYAVKRKDKSLQRLVHTLAAFAFYAGVGKQTTMGLGQVRQIIR